MDEVYQKLMAGLEQLAASPRETRGGLEALARAASVILHRTGEVRSELGRWGMRLGRSVEWQVREKLRSLLGESFRVRRAELWDERGEHRLAEIDAVVRGPGVLALVSVKLGARVEDVEELARAADIYRERTGEEPDLKILFSDAVVPEEVARAAREAGIHLVRDEWEILDLIVELARRRRAPGPGYRQA